MKKPVKILLVLASLGALAVAGLAVFLKVKYPPERIKALAAEQVKKHLNREMRLESASVGLARGLVLEGFELSERPDFSAGTFVSSRRAAAKPFLLPLLAGRVVVKSVELAEPKVSVVRFADGTFNFSDIAGSTEPAAGAPAEEKSEGVSLLVQRFILRDGSASFEDRSPDGINIAARDLNLTVESFSLAAPFGVELACALEGRVKEQPLQGRVAGRARVSVFGGGEAEIESLAVDFQKTSLALSGSVKNFSDPRADLSLKILSFDPKSVEPFAPLPPALADAALSGDLKLEGGTGGGTLRGGLRISASGVRLGLDLEASAEGLPDRAVFQAKGRFADLAVENSALAPGVKISGLSGEFSVKGSTSAADAEATLSGDQASLAYGEAVSKAPGAVFQAGLRARLRAPFDDPSFEAEGRAENLVLTSAPPLPADPKLGGSAALRWSARGTPGDFSFEADVDGKNLHVSYADLFNKPAGSPLTVKASGGLKDQKDLQLKSFRAELGGPALTGQGRVSDAAGAGRMDLAFKAAPFALETLAPMVPMVKEYKLSGKAGLDLAVKGTFAEPKISGAIALKDLGAVPAQGLSFAALNGGAAFTQDSLSLDDLRGKLNGAGLNLKARVKDFSKPDVFCEGRLEKLDAGALLAAFAASTAAAPGAAAPQAAGKPAASAPAPAAGSAPSAAAPFALARVQGGFQVDLIVHPNYEGRKFRLDWDLSDVDPSLAKVSGSADFKAADGKIHNLPLAAKINKLLKRDASVIEYQKISGRFKMTKGLLETQDFTVEGGPADILAKGTVDLGPLRADLRATLKLPKDSVGGSVGDWFSDDDGRPTLDAVIQGPLADPSIKVDAGRAAKRAGEQLLKKGLEKFMKKAPEDSGTPESPAEQKPAEKPADKAIQEGLKALDKLFKKK
ncbi:MAG: DUF748 domain-containing protein [Elusimicrobiota bacterium]